MSYNLKTPSDWKIFLAQLNQDLSELPQEEFNWILERLNTAAAIQVQLDNLFSSIDGQNLCRSCRGTCCDHGRHHLTLTNVLALVLSDEILPEPDFNQSCPFGSSSGCRLPVPFRPYNCITFFCDILESKMSQYKYARWRFLDASLREQYVSMACRFPSASMQGLILALGRLTGKKILFRFGH